MEFVSRKICLKKFKSSEYNQNHWGVLTGKTGTSSVEYYTGQTTSNAVVAIISLFITQTFDDVGVMTDVYDWTGKTINSNAGVTVNFVGQSKINEFRRYSKKTDDPDLYNPSANSGFTQTIPMGSGLIKKIKGSRKNTTGGKQALYDYVIGANENDMINTGIHYSDLDSSKANISYHTSGLTADNSLTAPAIKEDYLFGYIKSPKIKKDVFIDRGVNSAYYKNLILGDIRGFKDMETYGNGAIIIKEN